MIFNGCYYRDHPARGEKEERLLEAPQPLGITPHARGKSNAVFSETL